MARMRYSVGDKVLVSRAETGEDHEPGVVVDSYELIIGEERKPMVVVEFEDGERQYLTATTPNVLPVYEEEDEEAEAAETEPEAETAEEEAEEDTQLLDHSHAGGNGEVIFVDDEEGASP